MDIYVAPVPVEEILPLRERYRAQMDCQIVHDSLHEREFTRPYAIKVAGETAGYGTVVGFGDEPKETVNEFYLLNDHRAAAQQLFREFVATSRAIRIRAQTNDRLLTLMLYDCADNIEREKILFADAITTSLDVPGATYAKVSERDHGRMFRHRGEGFGDWMIESGGEIVATGGILFHYNPPYGDIYMEVAEPHRRRGFGSYLVQELKRTCTEMDKTPAARCDASNTASRATLQRAGMLPCASILTGEIRRKR
ncbi:MAG: hypothetical protein BMS9Abin29_1042 [Gemmatimonadota bacterium]|nr:MAG: hypothetical protein BMS9Abin29_1042 [Gemmatimonadota bacterium]